jgi:hypothetical protein
VILLSLKVVAHQAYTTVEKMRVPGCCGPAADRQLTLFRQGDAHLSEAMAGAVMRKLAHLVYGVIK